MNWYGVYILDFNKSSIYGPDEAQAADLYNVNSHCGLRDLQLCFLNGSVSVTGWVSVQRKSLLLLLDQLAVYILPHLISP